MAGSKNNMFKEKTTDYINNQMVLAESVYGKNSKEYNAWAFQYLKSNQENIVASVDRDRHYQSEVHMLYEGTEMRGVERLYRRTILIEPTSVCAAHCRWCLRGLYPLFTLKDEEISLFARYCGDESVRDDLRELLITGGDPFMVPKKLQLIIQEVKQHAPNIEILRIGTRIPVQDPNRVNADLLDILESAKPLKIEIATHVNHPVELTKEASSAFKELNKHVFKIYDQTVLLKGVNDDLESLRELYDSLRYLGIEAHYLFHCIPMKGMTHHRTTVQKGLDLISHLVNAGHFSGRAKPMYTLMTDLGKISLYEGTILERNNNNEILCQSKYTLRDFKKRNNSWVMPNSCYEDENGFLRVWYPDGAE